MGRNGERLRMGRSVYEQPGAKVDGITSCQRRDSKKVKENGKGTDKETSKGSKKGELRHSLILSICICLYNNCVNATNNLMCLGYK
jgi:hypothetical protein